MRKLFGSFLSWDRVLYILLGAAAYILLGTLLVNLVIKSPQLAFCFTLGLVGVVLLSASPLKALTVIVFIIPFTGTILLNGSLIRLPGVKPLPLLALFVMVIAVINYKKAVQIPDSLFFFILPILALFTISIIRALSHLDMINAFLVDDLSPQRFILSAYIKPLIFFMPLVIIAKFASVQEDVKFVVNMICYSMLAFSCLVIYLYFFECPARGNVGKVREYFHVYFGFHTNRIVNFYILSLPLLISKFFVSKNIVNILNLMAAAVAVGVLYSRSGYAICMIAVLLYLIFSKRAKMIPVLVGVAALLIVFVVSDHIIERAAKGMDSKDGGDISAGRIEHIWAPLVDEYSRDFMKLAIGKGRYAILYSDSARGGRILSTKHPHNMYLEQILDAGLVGLALFMLFYLFLIRQTYVCMRKTEHNIFKEYQCATLVALLCYLLSGFTDRTFFPDPMNGFLWVIVGITVVIVRMEKHGERDPGFSDVRVK